MKFARQLFTTALGFSLLVLTQSAISAYPAIYFSRKSINTSLDACLNKAIRIMNKEGLTNVRQVDANDVFGHNANSNVGISCIYSADTKTRVTITVAGDNVNEAKTLLTTLNGEI